MSKFTTETVQQRINERASKRLKKDLEAISNFIRGNRLMNPSDNSTERPRPELFEKKGDKFDGSTPYWIFKYERQGSALYMDRLFEYWLPVYVQEETNEFFSRIDQLTDDVDELLNISRD